MKAQCSTYEKPSHQGTNKASAFPLPETFILVGEERRLLGRAGDDSSCAFLCSAVRTEDKAATAAALCDPVLPAAGFGDAPLPPEDGLNAEVKAAKAEAL